MQKILKRYLLYSARKINSKFGMTYKKTDLSRKNGNKLLTVWFIDLYAGFKTQGGQARLEEGYAANKIYFRHEIPCEWLMQGETSLVRSLSSPET